MSAGLLRRARDAGLDVRAYVSMCFGDPWEDFTTSGNDRVAGVVPADDVVHERGIQHRYQDEWRGFVPLWNRSDHSHQD